MTDEQLRSRIKKGHPDIHVEDRLILEGARRWGPRATDAVAGDRRGRVQEARRRHRARFQ